MSSESHPVFQSVRHPYSHLPDISLEEQHCIAYLPFASFVSSCFFLCGSVPCVAYSDVPEAALKSLERELGVKLPSALCKLLGFLIQNFSRLSGKFVISEFRVLF